MSSGKEQEHVPTGERRAIPVLVSALAAIAALVGLYMALWSFFREVSVSGTLEPLYIQGGGILVVVLALVVYCKLQKPRRPFFRAAPLRSRSQRRTCRYRRQLGGISSGRGGGR